MLKGAETGREGLFKLGVDASIGEHIIRRPQPDGVNRMVADLFFTISDFYLNCGRVGSFLHWLDRL
jgi:hypothetical protein